MVEGTKEELLESIRGGWFKPNPVRRKEIPKPDGGVRKLGIPTVIDRIVQQAIAQVLTPIYEPLFIDGSYGYRPNRSAQMAISKVKEYAEQGYRYAVLLDLSKYFDTLQHAQLLLILRRTIKNEGVIQLIKKYLKSGVMENGIRIKTVEGSPQGGPLSPLLANIYLNEFDQELKAYRNGNTRKGYWAVAKSGILKTTITDKRLAQAGYFDILAKYESLHI